MSTATNFGDQRNRSRSSPRGRSFSYASISTQKQRPGKFPNYSSAMPTLIERNIQLSTHIVLDGAPTRRLSMIPSLLVNSRKLPFAQIDDVGLLGLDTFPERNLCLSALLKLLCQWRVQSNASIQEHMFKLAHQHLESLGILRPLDSCNKSMEAILNDYAQSIDLFIGDLVKRVAPSKEDKNLLSPHNDFLALQLSESHYRNDFNQLEKLGKGGYGTVYKVLNKLDKREYAVKQIPLKSKHPDEFKVFEREVEVFSSLKHPNVVEYISSWIESSCSTSDSPDSSSYTSSATASVSFATNKENEPITKSDINGSTIMPYSATLYIQMELCSMTLRDWIAKRNQNIFLNTDPFQVINEDASDSIFRHILAGVDYIHSQKLIHRDLTPSNIFINGNGNMAVKIGDFGLARARVSGSLEDLMHTVNSSHPDGTSRNANLTANVGTMTYSAPEQLTGGFYDQKADMYSLGLITFELFYPFATEMEKSIVLMSLKTLDGLIMRTDSLSVKWPTQMKIIRRLLHTKPTLRPSAAVLFKQVCKKVEETQVHLAVAKKVNIIRSLQKKNRIMYSVINKKNLKIREMQRALNAKNVIIEEFFYYTKK